MKELSFLLHNTCACLHTCIIRPTLGSSVWLWIPTEGFPSTLRRSLTCFVARGELRCHHTFLPLLMGLTVTCSKVSPAWNCKIYFPTKSDSHWYSFLFFLVQIERTSPFWSRTYVENWHHSDVTDPIYVFLHLPPTSNPPLPIHTSSHIVENLELARQRTPRKSSSTLPSSPQLPSTRERYLL